MSVDLIVYLRRSEMPSPFAWQHAIQAAGFPVELDPDFDLDHSKGFRPCKLRGLISGFEYYGEPLSEADRVAVDAPATSDFSVTLVTHSDLKEFACSVAAAAALARASNGVLLDPQSGDSFASDDAIRWANEQFAEAERFAK